MADIIKVLSIDTYIYGGPKARVTAGNFNRVTENREQRVIE